MLFLGLVLLLGIGHLALAVGVSIDAGSQPEWAFERAGTSKTLWVVLPLVSLFFCFVGALVVGIVWFVSFRPRVIAVTRGLPPGAPPAPPPSS